MRTSDGRPSPRPWLARLVASGVAMLWLAAARVAFGASPTPTPAAGDPRSAGEGPGLVGEPLVAIVIVLVVGVSTALVTAAWARFGRSSGPDRG
jgi:hypothetical protein